MKIFQNLRVCDHLSITPIQEFLQYLDYLQPTNDYSFKKLKKLL